MGYRVPERGTACAVSYRRMRHGTIDDECKDASVSGGQDVKGRPVGKDRDRWEYGDIQVRKSKP